MEEDMSLISLKINQEYAKLVPALTRQDYDRLYNSIILNGLYEPITINQEGIILDGHHRYKICQELNKPIKTRVEIFENKLLEKKYVIESNLNRRHLTDFQKIELGMKLLEINEELARQRMSEGGKGGSNDPTLTGRARDITAKQIGVSSATFERAKKIIELAPEKVKQDLRDGKTTINKEYQTIRKKEKKKERQQALKQTQVILPNTVQIHNEDFRKLKVGDGLVSLIITDPPYAEKYLSLYEDLGKQAARVLRDGGSLLCYAGHYAIGRIISMVEKHGLNFHWPIAVLHSGPSASVFGYKVMVGYKPLLWFVKGKYEGEFVRDVIRSEFQGKELHEWAQSTMESDYYIKYLTLENDIVYDPFLGQGTFGISAVKLKRQFIGAETDKEHFETARRLLSIANKS